MNNIPIFTASGGTATLILKEIPTRKTAYVLARIWIQGGLTELLTESAAFCRTAGAEAVYCTASEKPEGLPHAYDLVSMSLALSELAPPEKPVALEKVDGSNLAQFRDIYNTCFRNCENATTYSLRDAERIAGQERCFLALCDGQYAGIGQLLDHELCAIGVLPHFHGLGEPLARTLLRLLPGPEATLLVSTSNVRALALYRRLGFREDTITSSWYSA